MSRWVAVVGTVVGMGWVFVGCGGEDPAHGEPDTPDTPDTDTSADPAAEAPSDADSGLDLDIAGRTEPMTARATLEIAEGERPVHVAITGLSSGTDFVMIDLTFDGLENALGPHHVQFSLPEGGAHVAIGNLDDTPYYSQGGDIDLSVSADGEISGTFDILLARGAPSDPGQPFVYSVSDDATHLAGSFSGDWELDCHSRLMGHTSFVPGGKYCEQLEF